MDKKLELVSVIQELESRYEIKKEKHSKDGDICVKYLISRPSFIDKSITKAEIYLSVQMNYQETNCFADLYVKINKATSPYFKTHRCEKQSTTFCLLVYTMTKKEHLNNLLNTLNEIDIISLFLKHHDFNSIFSPNITIVNNKISLTFSLIRKIKKNKPVITVEIDENNIKIKNDASETEMSVLRYDLHNRLNLIKWFMYLEDSPNKK